MGVTALQGPGGATPQTVLPHWNSPSPSECPVGCCSSPCTGKAVGSTSCPRWGGCQLCGVPGCPQSWASPASPLRPLPRRYQVHLPWELLCLPMGGWLSPIAPHSQHGAAWLVPTPAWGSAGAAEGVSVKSHPVPLSLSPCSHPPALLGCPPLAVLHPLSWALTPKETLRQMVLTPAPPAPGCSSFAHGGPGAAGGARLAPLGLFTAGGPPHAPHKRRLGQG